MHSLTMRFSSSSIQCPRHHQFADSSTPPSSRSVTPGLSSVIDSPSSEPPSSASVDEKSDYHQDQDDSDRIRDKASPQL